MQLIASTSARQLQLARRQIVSLHHGKGACITCDGGMLWITVGDTRDILLGAGESFTIDRDDLVLVNALRSSRLSVQQPGKAASPLQRMASRLLFRAKRLLIGRLICPSIPRWRRQIYY